MTTTRTQANNQPTLNARKEMARSSWSRQFAALTVMSLFLLGSMASLRASVADPIPLPLITKGNIHIELQTVATGLTAPIDLEDAADGSGRLFIVEQTGKVKILANGAILPTPFLDVTDRLVTIMPDYDERGLLGLAFHPDFNNPSAPGYHKIYTDTSEPADQKADFTEPDHHPFDH